MGCLIEILGGITAFLFWKHGETALLVTTLIIMFILWMTVGDIVRYDSNSAALWNMLLSIAIVILFIVAIV